MVFWLRVRLWVWRLQIVWRRYLYRGMVEQRLGERSMETGRGKWLGREWVGEWRGKGDMLEVLGHEYPWAAGDSIGRMFGRLDRGQRGEVYADWWQDMTQGSTGRLNRHTFWMDFDDCFREGRLEAWKVKDPWTVRNRKNNLRQRVRGRLWSWGVRLRVLHRMRPVWLAARRAEGRWAVLGKGCWSQVEHEVQVLQQLQGAVWGYREQVTVWLPGLVVKVYRLGVFGRVCGDWRSNWECWEAGWREKLEQVRGRMRLRRGFEIWWQRVLVGRLGFTVFRKPGIGATGDWTVGALKKGWEKLQAKRGFGVWKGLMGEGRKLRAAGWKWQEPRKGAYSFFAFEDLEAGYVRDKYY